MECSGIWHSGSSSSNGEICDLSRGRGEIVGWGEEEGRRARKSEDEEGRKGSEEGGEEDEDEDSVQPLLATKC